MRRRLFHGDNMFFRVMGKLGDFMCLNILCLLAFVPVITIGAAVSALYDVLYGMSEGKEGKCFRRYAQAFRKHFGKATAYWMFCLLAAVFLMTGALGVGFMNGGIRVFFRILTVVFGLLWTGILSFGLILISWTDISLRSVFRNAALITAGSFPWLILSLLITCIPVLLITTGNRLIMAYGMPLFVLFGIPLLCCAKTCIYKQALKKYGLMPESKPLTN